MNIGLEEYIYKYYIHHGVSVYLTAWRDHVNPELWLVSVQNLYSPGKDLGFGSCPNVCNNCYSLGCRNNYCVCKGSKTAPLCNKSQIEQRIYGINTGMNKSSNIRMTTSELERLMRKLNTSNGIDIKQGNIILY